MSEDCRSGGTGKMIIFRVDQGFEHGPATFAGQSPAIVKADSADS